MGAVNHSFVNPKADSADTTITRPSDWNAAHAVDWGETGDIVTQSYSDTPAGGALDEIARADHRHGMPANGNGLGWFNVKDAPYNAVGNGVANDTAAIQAAIDAAEVAGGLVFFPVGVYKVTTLNLPPMANLVGTSRDTSGTFGTVILGTATYPILSLPTAGVPSGFYGSDFHVRDLQLSGGIDCLQSLTLATHGYFDNVSFAAASRSALYIEGAIEEFYFRNCQFIGGTNTIWLANVGYADPDFPLVFVNYIDKSVFSNCQIGGGSINNLRLEGAQYDYLKFGDCTFGGSGQHGVFVDSPGGRGLMFVNAITEGNGQSGKNARTTSTVGAGSTACTLASATGFANGDPITIAGAGLYGVDHTTTIAALAGTAATLAVAAVTAVTTALTTNASWDDFHFADGAGTSDTTFDAGWIGGEGTFGRLRYALKTSGSTTLIGVSTIAVPVYNDGHDVNIIGGAGLVLRQPRAYNLDYLDGANLSIGFGVAGEYSRNLVPSAPGGDLILGMRSFQRDFTTFGNLEVRKADVNRTTLLQLDPTGQLYAQGRVIGADGVVPFVKAGTISDGDFQTTPISGTLAVDTTNSQLYVRIGATWKKVTLT